MINCFRACARLVPGLLSKCNVGYYGCGTSKSSCLLDVAKMASINTQLCNNYGSLSYKQDSSRSLLSVVSPFTPQPSRNIIKFSLKKGKRKSSKDVLKRFYRLDWGVWIRTKCGRAKKMYKKSANRKRRLRQHVFTNATQSWLLDKMVTAYWRRPRFYVDDPYEPYHSREEFPVTRRKPYVPSN